MTRRVHICQLLGVQPTQPGEEAPRLWVQILNDHHPGTGNVGSRCTSRPVVLFDTERKVAVVSGGDVYVWE